MSEQLQTNTNTNLDSANLLFFAIKWWKHLATIAVVTALLAFIFSSPWFVKPKYKSTVILFPTTTNSISKALLNDDDASKKDILEFGEEEQAEQLLQILNSDDLRDIIIKKYDLMKHYEIDPNGDYPFTKLYKKFEGNVSFDRTEFMSVKIEVLDTDPQLAAKIANDISHIVDSMKTVIQRDRAEEALKIVSSEYNSAKHTADSMETRLAVLRKDGIFDYMSQTKIYNETYSLAMAGYELEKGKLDVYKQSYPATDTIVIRAQARVNGYAAQIKQSKVRLDELASKGGDNMNLTEYLFRQRKLVADLSEKLHKSTVDAKKSLTNTFIVNKAVPAEKKSYPLRSLIMLIASVGAVLMSIVVIMILENINSYKAKNRQETV